jgi:membrane peptidoglycan carboxypeptidase
MDPRAPHGLSKERLLEIYLNIIEWGPDVHGAGEAARFYFDRDPAELSVSEALFLTTIVPSPLRWRSRLDASGALRPWEKAHMHFIGRAMIAKGWLRPRRSSHRLAADRASRAGPSVVVPRRLAPKSRFDGRTRSPAAGFLSAQAMSEM